MKLDDEKKRIDVDNGYKTEEKSDNDIDTEKKSLRYFINSIKYKEKIIILICVSIILVLALIASTILALININNTKIVSGVTINGIEISGLSKEEAIQQFNEISDQKLEDDILIKADNFEYVIKLSQIETKYNIEKAIEEAYNVGRQGNIFSNNYEIAKTMLWGKEINLEYTYNEELLNNILADIESKVPNPVTESNYCIENDKLIITKGKAGNSIDKEQIKAKIIGEILSNNTNDELNVYLVKKDPGEIDIDSIYAEVYTEAKDAYYTKDPFQIFPHVNGVNFDVEAAKELLKEDKEEYEIPLTITVPEITTDKIGTEAFPDLLSSFSTRYDASNTSRTTNLKLAMSKLDGVIVASGETFSYNKTLGKRTAEAGYQEAGGYAGGKVVQTLAGGICQISSTLYDAVVYANLDIVERHNHMFLAGYVGAGKDATVVYGSLDFQFKNTRKYPVMIKTTIGSGVAKIDIYGIREEVEYDVDIVTNVLSYTPFKVVYEEDSSLGEGKQRVTQNGMNGCKSITYKVLKLNGTEVSREVLSSDTYDPMNKIIRVGTKKKTTTTSTTVKKETSSNKKETSSNNKKTEESSSNTKSSSSQTKTNTTANTTTKNNVNNITNTN